MNTAALLALIGDLYAQVADLQTENSSLRSALAAQESAAQESGTST